MPSKFIEIKPSARQVAYVTHDEAWKVLKMDAQLWETAIKRGKAFKRAASRKKQEAAYYEKHYQDKGNKIDT